MGVAIRNSRTASTEAQQLALRTLLEIIVFTIGVHLLSYEDVVQWADGQIAHYAVESAARHNLPVGQDCEVAVGAVAAIADYIVGLVGGYGEESLFVEVERPKMILEVEDGATLLMLLELLPHSVQKIAILLGGDVGTLLKTRGAIARKCEDAYPTLNNQIYDRGNLLDVCARNGSHYGAFDACTVDAANLFESYIERARASHLIVCRAQSIDRELIFVASVRAQSVAHLVAEVEWITQNGEGDFVLLKQRQNIPETRMQNWVATREVYVREAQHTLTHSLDVAERVLDLLVGHRLERECIILREDVAMFATLVARIGNVPLESKIFHNFCLKKRLRPMTGTDRSFTHTGCYFSPAPQAEPQAAGLGSAGLPSSPAPQAEPQAPLAPLPSLQR